HVLDDLRAGWFKYDAVRRSPDPDNDFWLAVSVELVSIRAGDFRDHAGADFCLVLAMVGRAPALEPGQVLIWIVLCGTRIRSDHSRRHSLRRRSGQPFLADHGLLHSNRR